MHFRCTALEKKAIQKQAEQAGLQDAEYVRASALGQKISFKLTPDEVEVYKLLAEYRTNFKHISNLFKNRTDISEKVKTLVHLIDQHLKKIV